MEKKYVLDNFEKLVLEREKVAPTAYGNLFSIPHPIKKEGLVNKIAICSLNKPIEWNDKKVRLVFLICLSKNNREQDDGFDELFERIISLLDNPRKTDKLINELKYDHFINIFFDK